jgi:hypothetical protein
MAERALGYWVGYAPYMTRYIDMKDSSQVRLGQAALYRVRDLCALAAFFVAACQAVSGMCIRDVVSKILDNPSLSEQVYALDAGPHYRDVPAPGVGVIDLARLKSLSFNNGFAASACFLRQDLRTARWLKHSGARRATT